MLLVWKACIFVEIYYNQDEKYGILDPSGFLESNITLLSKKPDGSSIPYFFRNENAFGVESLYFC